MKSKRLVLVLLIIVVLFVSCANQTALGTDGAEQFVSMCITGYNNEIILSLTEVGLYKDETVLDVLIRAARENNFQLDYSGIGATAYVKGIDNLYEFDYGAQSGWIYLVDSYDGTPGVSSGAFALSDNDLVDWIYVTEQTTKL